MEYRFHPDLKALSDKYPLSDTEREQLKTLLKEKGQINPILIWDGYVVDGHNRIEIMKELDKEPYFKEVAFDSLSDAQMFIIENYLGQRNLNDGQKWDLAQEKIEILRRKGKENLKTNIGEGQRLSIVDKGKEHNTQKELASELGWSTGKVAMADKVWREAKPEMKEQVKSGEVSINQAYKQLSNEEKKKKRAKEINKRAALLKETPLPERRYDVILADPPWRYDYSKSDSRKIENQYPTMSIDELCGLNIPSNENSVLYLWTTAPKLEESFRVINAWGFNYKSCAIWDKEKIGMGYWFRGQHELLIVGVKGSFSPPESNKRYSSVIKSKRAEHSEKPEKIYEIIESAYPNNSKIELFCRNPREGWDSWGNEI